MALVTLADAMAYAKWLGHDLPTEAEWEFAARGGRRAELLEREPRGSDGKPTANYWQGHFPDLKTREDGYAALAPVGCFQANGYGLYDMIGNVWEWTVDVYAGQRQGHGNGDPLAGVHKSNASFRGDRPMVIKGGSFLCSQDYCVRYRVAARHPHEANLAASHVGFRTISRDAPSH